MTDIFGSSSVSLEAAQAWARARGGHQRYVDVAQWFWKHAPAYGIPPENPYALASWETNYGRYTGVLGPEKHNWGGIKTATGWSDTDPAHHQTFTDDEQGALAVIQHLYRYGGRVELPAGETLVDPRYHLITKTTATIEGLGGAWAPNAQYGANVAKRVADLRSFANDGAWSTPVSDIPIIPMLLPVGASNAPAGTAARLAPRYITIHETANPKPGADAVMHGRWLQNLAAQGAGEPSWHYTVDDHQIVQHLPEDRAGWHAGDGAGGTGNRESIGIELCVNADGDTQRTRDNAAWLVRQIMARHGIPAERVVQHNHWSGKDCPRLLRQSGWAEFVASLTTPAPAPAPAYREFPETGHGIGGGFLWFWKHNGGLPIFGYPLTDEQTDPETGLTVQYFERAVFEYHPENDDPWKVLLRRLGAEELARREAAT